MFILLSFPSVIFLPHSSLFRLSVYNNTVKKCLIAIILLSLLTNIKTKSAAKRTYYVGNARTLPITIVLIEIKSSVCKM